MFDNLDKIIKDNDEENNKINFAINTNNKSQIRRNSKQKSSKLMLCIKNDESYGVSL